VIDTIADEAVETDLEQSYSKVLLEEGGLHSGSALLNLADLNEQLRGGLLELDEALLEGDTVLLGVLGGVLDVGEVSLELFLLVEAHPERAASVVEPPDILARLVQLLLGAVQPVLRVVKLALQVERIQRSVVD
jgi:hypothetical protein